MAMRGSIQWYLQWIARRLQTRRSSKASNVGLARNFGPGGTLGKCYGNAMEMLWKCYEHLGNAMENGHFNGKLIEVPSGKPTKNDGKSQCLMGISTTSTINGHFQ